MITGEAVERMVGAITVDAAHERIGRVHHVLLDAESELPTWVSVQLVAEGNDSQALLPLEGADWDDHELHVAIREADVRDAPGVATTCTPSAVEEDLLCGYYGVGVSYSVHDEASYEAIEVDLAEDLAPAR